MYNVHNVYVHLYFLKLDFDDLTIFLTTKGVEEGNDLFSERFS